MKTIIHTILLIAIAGAWNACSVHEFPDDRPVDPTSIQVEVHLNISADIQVFAEYISATRASEQGARSIIDIYELDQEARFAGDAPLKRMIVDLGPAPFRGADYSVKTTLTLQAKRYRVLIWTDLTNSDTENRFYTTDDLKNISIKLPYQGVSDLKDAFCGSCDIDLMPYRNQWGVTIDVPIQLEHPFAKIEVITTDLQTYYERAKSKGITLPEEISVKVSYAGYFPSRYNVSTGKPNDVQTGVWFNSVLVPLSDQEAMVTHDYIFVNGTESGVSMNLSFYSKDKHINTVEGINIPIQRGKRTTIRGDFLTRDYRPGIHIDPSYDGDGIIHKIED